MDSGGEPLAPVIPLFSPSRPDADHCGYPATDPDWNATWEDDVDDDRLDEEEDDREEDLLRPAADRLMRKLRRRGLSVAEATASLVADGVDRVIADVFVTELVSKRWLGDADLAEQLVHVAVTRKGEGRRAIAQTLAKRGIPRDVADAALAALPDDDAERALEFARSKTRSMGSLDHDTALRRLMGQLARRGYSGSTAVSAAKQALADEGIGGSRVRFH